MYYLVSDRHENLAYDSYFYATVFDPETYDYFESEYGSTAWAESPHQVTECGGELSRFLNGQHQTVKFSLETPQWVLDLYRRIVDVRARLTHRAKMKEIAKELNLGNYHEASRLTNAFVGWETYNYHSKNYFAFKAIYNLLKTKKFRSAFRQSLAEQVRSWVKEVDPKYEKPLSPKQLSYLIYK